MPAPVLNSIEQQNAIEMLAINPNQSEIARQLGVSAPTINRIKSKNAEKIEQLAEKYISALPSIIENDLKEIAANNKLTTELINLLQEESQIIETKDGKIIELFQEKRIQAIQKFKESVDKKVTDIKRSIGILNSHTPAVVFQNMNIFNNNQQVISNSVINALIGNQRQSEELPDDIDMKNL